MQRSILFLLFLCIMVFFFGAPSSCPAAENSKNQNDSSASKETPLPPLSAILPQAAELVSRRATLEQRLRYGFDTASIEKQYEKLRREIEQKVPENSVLSTHMERVEQAEVLETYIYELDAVEQPLREQIDNLENSLSIWYTDKRVWMEWEKTSVPEEISKELNASFSSSLNIIESAINLLRKKIDEIFSLQGRIVNTKASLHAYIENIREFDKSNYEKYTVSPPMYDKIFWEGFLPGAWSIFFRNLQSTTWEDFRLSALTSILLIISVFIVIIVRQKTKDLVRNDSFKIEWSSLIRRPIASTIFVISIFLIIYAEYNNLSLILYIVLHVCLVFSFGKMMHALLSKDFEKKVLYVILAIYISIIFFENFIFPTSPFRLFVLGLSIYGFYVLAIQLSANGKEKFITKKNIPLILFSLIFLSISFFQFFGDEISSYSFSTTVIIMSCNIVFLVTMLKILNGFTDYIVGKFFFESTDEMKKIEEKTKHLVKITTNFPILLITFGMSFMAFGVAPSLAQAFAEIFGFSFKVGGRQFSLGLILFSVGIFYATYVASLIINNIFLKYAFRKGRVEEGVRFSISRLLHYTMLLVGFIIALSILGFDMTQVTILLSALGVGIGFGLQNIVNNFVCGLILLFEQPVRVGDIVQLENMWARIKEIGLRATVVETFEQSEVILPNSDLITGRVTNWTLDNRHIRIVLPVGVAYGSDLSLVMQTLLDCTKEDQRLMSSPQPQVLFRSFGDSTLNFERRVWLRDVNDMMTATSDLLLAIDAKFRKAGIEISFPQMDLHLRSVDQGVFTRPAAPQEQA